MLFFGFCGMYPDRKIVIRPCGPMDKTSAYGAGDSRLKSCQGASRRELRRKKVSTTVKTCGILQTSIHSESMGFVFASFDRSTSGRFHAPERRVRLAFQGPKDRPSDQRIATQCSICHESAKRELLFAPNNWLLLIWVPGDAFGNPLRRFNQRFIQEFCRHHYMVPRVQITRFAGA